METKGKAALTFALYQGSSLVRRETIIQNVVKVGRDPKSHLRIDDDNVSRMHAVIEIASPDDITLIDLGNESGTRVNGNVINKCKIRPGDRIEFGATEVVLESASPAADAVVGPPPAMQRSTAMGIALPEKKVEGGGDIFGSGSAGARVPPPVASPFMASHGGAFGGFSDRGVSDTALPGTYTYELIKGGPDVSSDEVEVLHQSAVEVVVFWDTTILHVDHLSPPRSYYVGEQEGKQDTCDYFLPSEKLGTKRCPVVLAAAAGVVSVILPPRAQGYIELAGRSRVSLQDAIQQGLASPSGELQGAHQVDLNGMGSRVRLEFEGGLVIQVTSVVAGKRLPPILFAAASVTGLMFVGLSFLVHVGLLAGMAFFKPALGGIDDEEARREQQYLMQQFLKASAEREEEEKPPEESSNADANNKEGGTGTRAKGEEGSMGNPTTKETGKRFGVQGPQDNPDPHVARTAALKEAAEFGIIGLLNAGAGGDPNAPTAPWGREDSLGNDAMSARGNMWGDAIGDSFGAGGLGLSGIGEGGGGKGEGIGLGSIGTIGHGSGSGTGSGFGSGHGRFGGSHSTKAPQVRMGATQVSGRLPPEVIQRIVRQNYGRFRLCYEQGLKSNPNLQGRVAVRFVIGRDGAVANVGNGGSDLADSGVVSCVIRSFSGLSFPQPEGGIVTVTYPIMLSPGS